MPFVATWMELEVIILSEIKSEGERQITFDLTHTANTETKEMELTKLNQKIP